MDNLDQIAQILALTMGASWASGINLYAAMAMLGISAATGNFVLPPGLEVLANPMVIGAASVMYVVEFVADKIPGVDSSWDGLHTFIRIPAGAMMAAGAVGDVNIAMEVSAALLGGGMAAATHATKAGSRVVINTSPEPFSNWTASVGEDVAVIGGIWTAMHHPWVFLGLLIVFIIFMIWLLPKIATAIKGIFRFFGRLFGGEKKSVGDGNYTSSTEGPSKGGIEKLQQLEKLKELYDDKALTSEEFELEKKRLLDQM
ncbi:MAG: DUF4126 family protein [Magnetococcales bacterium]|nr:DUF4126 family protein [Magnetococcales bacterium]